MESITVEQLKSWYSSHQDKVLKDFFTFLSFPSISSDPKYEKDCRACAHWLSKFLNQIGFQVEQWETPGLPIVFASHLKAGPHRPTLMIYHHYDVQPVDPIDLWHSDPFVPVIKNNQVYARGAVDNKGQCFYTLTALQAVMQLATSLDFNIKVFIEGEEESGGKGTAVAIQQYRERLKADHLLVIDFDMPAPRIPGITLGMRGLVALEVECVNSSIDLHSGSHGGIALNPNRALASLLAKMWDENGRVAIPHFYDAVKALSPKDLASIDMSFDKEQYEKSFGVKAYAAEKGKTIRESNWLCPSLEINGMWGGYTGEGFKTVIPSKAHAKISCRLVPDQDPEKIIQLLTQFLQDHAPEGIQIKVYPRGGAPAYRSKLDSPIVKTVALAYEEILGGACRYLLCGASVPIIVDLAAATGAEVAMIGMGLADDDIHAPNEHFGLDRFEWGYLILARTLGLLSSN
jgi:acetylornithine deacetylase/succinyl-diaminopimelate desuccinylase-like protein